MTTTKDTTPLGLYRKLAEVMGECGYVKKNGYNSFHKYNYVTEADLVDAVREKLAVRNVALIPSVTAVDSREYTTDKGKGSVVTTVRVAFTFCDGDTGETHTAEWAGAGDDSADKGIYKAYTGAVKYFLMKAFLIPTGDDPEGDTRTDERGAARAPAAPPAAPLPAIPADRVASIMALADEAAVVDKLDLALAHQGASSVDTLTAPQADKVEDWLSKKLDAKTAGVTA